MGITDSGDFPTENLTADELNIIIETLTKLFNSKISTAQAAQVINPIVGSPLPMQKISSILSITDDPIPPKPQDFTDNMPRHKTRPWMVYEDQRLLAAILRYGFENWVMIAEFVGNGRTRSQCSQRWNRGLNPKISKGTWSKEEEEKLLRLVSQNGDKSWTKISLEFGNRSDVQCRYRYQQLLKESQPGNSPNCSNSANDENVNDNIINEQNSSNNLPPISESITIEPDPKINIKEEKIIQESNSLIQPIITISEQPQIKKFNQSEILVTPIQQVSLTNITSVHTFSHQNQILNKILPQQEISSLPKISLPHIDPSIFMEC